MSRTPCFGSHTPSSTASVCCEKSQLLRGSHHLAPSFPDLQRCHLLTSSPSFVGALSWPPWSPLHQKGSPGAALSASTSGGNSPVEMLRALQLLQEGPWTQILGCPERREPHVGVSLWPSGLPNTWCLLSFPRSHSSHSFSIYQAPPYPRI